MAAGAAPLRQPNHDSRAADDAERPVRQQRPPQRLSERAARQPRPRQGRQAAGAAGAVTARANEDPATEFSPIWWIRFAAWQPLLFTPGAGYHYSNIGYDILGLIAARAGGKPLPALYRERIFQPLGLHATAYDPQGPISGPHAHGYGIEPNGKQIDTTDWHSGIGAEGGIVSDAEDTATFLTALMRGKLLDRQHLTAMERDNLWLGGAISGCAGQAYGWSGGGNGYKTEVWVEDGGSRVAVLLLNARHWNTAQPASDQAAHDALIRLYCSA